MILECRTPLPTTPDAIDFYGGGNKLTTETHSTETHSIEVTTTNAATTNAATTNEVTTDETATDAAATYSADLGQNCFFSKNEHGAIFQTASPYSNNMRKG